MKVPLFILGFLIRHGDLHGYKIKQLITEQASDFAKIKLPTIYYHLEQLQKKGLVTSQKEKKGRRPDRFVYEITSQGRKHFEDLLVGSLNTPFTAEFEIDAALFFRDAIDTSELKAALEIHRDHLAEAVKKLKTSREQSIAKSPDEENPMAKAIFSHQLVHHNAELRWVRAVILELDSKGSYTD